MNRSSLPSLHHAPESSSLPKYLSPLTGGFYMYLFIKLLEGASMHPRGGTYETGGQDSISGPGLLRF